MITYVAVLSSYVLGGMPANKDLNEWHEYAAPQDIGPGSAKYHSTSATAIEITLTNTFAVY